MLKKKTLTEVVYNNGDPFQVREAISATIGAWQKQTKCQPLWETLDIFTEYPSDAVYSHTGNQYVISVEAVYDAGN